MVRPDLIMSLRELIISKIRKSGPISFRDYMDMALYAPGYGYYTSGEQRVGKRGDFFTSPYISSAFGAMVARQIEEIWETMPRGFTIVEYGAGSGLLCYDILEYLRKNRDCYQSIWYAIIEKSPSMKRVSRQYLPGKVSWVDDISELGEFDGCVLSNELLDNFPVHRICFAEGEMKEIYVDFQDNLHQILRPLSAPVLNYITACPMEIAEEYCTEICLDAEGWYKDISTHLRSGYIITIDYGYLNGMLTHVRNNSGTIRSYKDHRLDMDFYSDPGSKDITADVNFSSLSYWGSKYAIEFAGIVDQSRFLRGLGFVPFLSDMIESEENKKFALAMLLDQMGSRFKVLVQRKQLPYHPLRGLCLEHPVEKKICAEQYVPFP